MAATRGPDPTNTGTDGSGPADRMRAAGYRVVSAGSDGAEAAVAVWMRSAPHRDILLTCRSASAAMGANREQKSALWRATVQARSRSDAHMPLSIHSTARHSRPAERRQDRPRYEGCQSKGVRRRRD